MESALSLAAVAGALAKLHRCAPTSLRPISVLTLSLLRLLDSNFPGNPLWTMRIPPPRVNIILRNIIKISTEIGRTASDDRTAEPKMSAFEEHDQAVAFVSAWSQSKVDELLWVRDEGGLQTEIGSAQLESKRIG